MARIDRDELLRRVSLPALADEIVGGRKGHFGIGASWPSPVPGHEQTGKSPPMKMFVADDGTERWTCFATGKHGTAFDLVMVALSMDFRGAIEWLNDRRGDPGLVVDEPRPTASARLAETPTENLEGLRRWLGACQSILWQRIGRDGLAWLRDRGLSDEAIVEGGAGFDPGASLLYRAEGLPMGGQRVTMPVYGLDGLVVFGQSRALAGDAPKYANPLKRFAVNPGVSWHLGASGAGPVVAVKGVADAWAAAMAGFDAVAVLGTGNSARASIVDAVRDGVAGRNVVVAFDADRDGLDSGCRFGRALNEAGTRSGRLVPQTKDLGEWLRRDGEHAFAAELHAMVEAAVSQDAKPACCGGALCGGEPQTERPQAYREPTAGGQEALVL